MKFQSQQGNGQQLENGKQEREGIPGAVQLMEAGDENKRSFLEIVHGVIFSPIQTMAAVRRQKPFWPSFLLLLGINLLTMAALLLSYDQYMYFNNVVLQQLQLSPEMIKKGLLYFSFCLFFVKLFFLFAFAGLLNLFGEFVGGKSNGIGLLTALCLTAVPDIFYAPLLFLGFLSPAGKMASGLGNLLLGLWSFGLGIIAVRETLELSTLRAFLVVFLPLLIGVAILVALVILAFAVFAA